MPPPYLTWIFGVNFSLKHDEEETCLQMSSHPSGFDSKYLLSDERIYFDLALKFPYLPFDVSVVEGGGSCLSSIYLKKLFSLNHFDFARDRPNLPSDNGVFLSCMRGLESPSLAN